MGIADTIPFILFSSFIETDGVLRKIADPVSGRIMVPRSTALSLARLTHRP
ncbi:hypothetical protein [Rhizobium alvei]|uniref:Uncharacterized protein n=1 Tax=Rhizobium alvei TaxID=1132659 RepID=A0ABT8YTW4_9HYPH|nr:hypothetical protein [Rhizobium alvei]MDO6967124.1 hypothetical protein [Rhizobium alvei]